MVRKVPKRIESWICSSRENNWSSGVLECSLCKECLGATGVKLEGQKERHCAVSARQDEVVDFRMPGLVGGVICRRVLSKGRRREERDMNAAIPIYDIMTAKCIQHGDKLVSPLEAVSVHNGAVTATRDSARGQEEVVSFKIENR